jgi:hypothetical protein
MVFVGVYDDLRRIKMEKPIPSTGSSCCSVRKLPLLDPFGWYIPFSDTPK